jgi:hypothetical protein
MATWGLAPWCLYLLYFSGLDGEVLDYLTQFTSEDCPQSLKDSDSSAPPDPKQEKDLPS